MGLPMWTHHEGEQVTVTRRCQWCNKETSVVVDRERFDRWQAGELVQNVFPEMGYEQREELVSGTHPACWKSMWGTD